MMVSRLILGTTISLALVLCPFLVNDASANKTSRKKSTQVSSKSSSGNHSSSASKRSSRRSAYRYETYYEYEYVPVRSAPHSSAYDTNPYAGYGASSYYRAGIASTGPLMRITPQRDGRFLLEPLGPQKAIGNTKNSSTLDRQMAPMRRGDDYSAAQSSPGSPISPRWNFSELLLTLAKRYEGNSYRRGASLETSSATDCSGFVQYVCQNFMVELPRTSSEQAHYGKTVTSQMDFSKLLPGDLLFFRRGGRGIGHVGIYMGNGKMIHASSPRTGIIVTDLNQPYYQSTFVVAKRVFEVQYTN
jgi:cell wall-associated NlpC family hydrolase